MEREREGRSGKKEEEEGRRPKIVTRQVCMLLMVHMVLHVSGISCLLSANIPLPSSRVVARGSSCNDSSDLANDLDFSRSCCAR